MIVSNFQEKVAPGGHEFEWEGVFLLGYQSANFNDFDKNIGTILDELIIFVMQMFCVSFIEFLETNNE